MTTNLRVAVTMAVIGAAFVVMTLAAHAQGSSGTTKPGWGFGDKNHVHTGPPGQSVHP